MTLPDHEIEYSRSIIKLTDLILIQRIANGGDWEAVAQYIVRRSNITTEEALDLDTEELSNILDGLSTAADASIALQKLGRSLR